MPRRLAVQAMEVSGHSGLKAWVDLLEVRIEPCRGSRARIVIVIPGPPDFLVVKIRSVVPVAFPQERESETGDASFDSRFSIEGRPLQATFALLDAETRRLLLRLSTECRLEISTGLLRAEMLDEEVPHILPLLLDIGRRLAQSMGDFPRRLAENVKRDPVARVRLQNLLLLMRELPGDPATVEALRTACSDSSPEGDQNLLELAEIDLAGALSAQAVSILDRELPFERLTTLLDLALDGGRIQAILACLETLGRRGGTAAIGLLARVLASEKEELAAAAAQVLGGMGSAGAEPPLIQALQYENTDVRTAAANALARAGSVAAVLPLKEVAERLRLDRDLRRAARQAIAEIQSRLPGTPGQLSLAGDEAGQLSLAQAEAGQLSLASAAAGQLSLTPEETKPGSR